jgi:hypothetical protein
MSNCTERGMNVKSSLAFNRVSVIFRFSTSYFSSYTWRDLSAFALVQSTHLSLSFPERGKETCQVERKNTKRLSGEEAKNQYHLIELLSNKI